MTEWQVINFHPCNICLIHYTIYFLFFVLSKDFDIFHIGGLLIFDDFQFSKGMYENFDKTTKLNIYENEIFLYH